MPGLVSETKFEVGIKTIEWYLNNQPWVAATSGIITLRTDMEVEVKV